MMKSILLIALLLFSFMGVSQSETSFVFGLYKSNSISIADKSYSWVGPYEEYNDVRMSFRNYGINAGMKFSEKLEVLIDLAFMNIPGNNSYNGPRERNMKTIKTGLNLNYRFLKNRIISPKIGVCGGFFAFSDLNGKKVSPSTLVQYEGNVSSYRFNSWKEYASIDVLASLQLESFNIDFGGVVNYQAYSITNNFFILSNEEPIVKDFGLGLKVAIKYQIPFSN